MRSLSATAELLVIINHPYVQCKQQLDFTAQEVPCGSVSCKSALRFAFACKERTEVLKYHSRICTKTRHSEIQITKIFWGGA